LLVLYERPIGFGGQIFSRRKALAGDETYYGYDRLYRLTSVVGPDGPRSYAYDPVGNRLSRVAGATTSYTYDRADRITSAGSTAITVDANGNMTAKGADSFDFDQANRLTSATAAGASETYVYDGNGKRFTRQVGANPAVRYVSDLGSRLPVTIDDGTRKYVYGLGLAYAVQGSTIEVYHADRLGSVRVLTNGPGAVVATYRADEWGVPMVSSGSSAQPFGFTAEPVDATGLIYLRARYYEPTLGLFSSRDRWPGTPLQPQTLNRFAYVGGNPTTLTDPSGYCANQGLAFGPKGGLADYASLSATGNFPVLGIFGPGATVGFTYTCTGHLYFTLGLGAGVAGGAGEVRAGRIIGAHADEDVDSFVSEWSVTGAGLLPLYPAPGVLGVGPTGGATWGKLGSLTASDFSGELGLGVGSIGGSVMGTYSWDLGFEGPSW
jgi:RHS repeat-associated protein